MNKERESLQKEFFGLLDSGEAKYKAAATLNLSSRTTRRWESEWRRLKKAIDASQQIINSDPSKNKDLIAPTKRFHVARHRKLEDYKRFVIISILPDQPTREDMLASFELYCAMNNAMLLVVPIPYRMKTTSVFNIKEEYLFFDDVQLGSNIKLLSRLNILPSIVDPFAGLDPLTKNHTIIVPNPQLRQKTMPSIGGIPTQMHSTGCISERKGAYPRNKTGIKAEFNHSNSAIVVEFGKGDSFWVRQLNCDKNGGFYDLVYGNEGYYSQKGFKKLERVAGLNPGDFHGSEADPTVFKATYTNEDSICKVAKPRKLFLHDSLSFYYKNHHDDGNYLLKWAKFHTGMSSVEQELDLTLGLIENAMNSCPPDAEVIVVESNHDKAFDKWLTLFDPKKDYVNAKFWHKMMWLTMDTLEKGKCGPKYSSSYELWFKNSKFNHLSPRITFIDGRHSYKLFDIEMSQHGHSGANGSRGSLLGYSRMPVKMNVGHSHAPGIQFGAWQAGTSTYYDLGYTGAISSWLHQHIVTHENGKRQMLAIIKGKWRATP